MYRARRFGTLQGVLGDSPRTSRQARGSRGPDPEHDQTVPHVLTQATGAWAPVWRRWGAWLPVREGRVVIDDTSVPTLGRHSVGGARQYG